MRTFLIIVGAACFIWLLFQIIINNELLKYETEPNSIYRAAEKGDTKRIAEILKKNPELVNTLNKAGLTPLHYAALENHVDVAKILLSMGADIEAKRLGGFTPLHDAIYRKHKDISEFLIAHGAKIHGEMSEAYIDKEMVQLLLDLGADVNQRDERDISPIDQAVMCGSIDVLKLLLDHGANINAKDKDGYTPLHHCANADVAKLLLEKGAVVDAETKQGITPLCHAIQGSQIKIAEVLILKGANVNARYYGNTLLHIIAGKGEPYKHPRFTWMPIPDSKTDEDDPCDIAKLLIANGANVNARDEQNSTPLHQAAENGTLRVVKLLIEHNADLNAKDDRGWTPLHKAVERGNIQIAELLLQKGADFTQQSNMGTPLNIAKVWSKNKKMAALLISYGAKN